MRFMKFRVLLTNAVCVGAFGLASCSKSDKGAEYDVVSGDPTGCIQGVVTNALTGARIPLDGAKMWVVFKHQVYNGLLNAADNGGLDADTKTAVQGDYSLCGIPNAGVALPMYISIDGYQERVYAVTVSSSTPNRNAGTAEPGFWVTPTVIQHVALYKVKDLVDKDFTVEVKYHGDVVKDAQVWLKATDVAGSTIEPTTTTTDKTGVATFKAATLAFGASYTITVAPKSPAASDGSYVLPMVSTSVTLGGSITALDTAHGLVAVGPFKLLYDLGATATGIAATSTPVIISTTAASTVTDTGTINITFDRNVVVDAASATITGGTTVAISSYGKKSSGAACVASDIGTPVLNTTSSVTVSVSKNSATITPNWTTTPSSTSTCGGITLTYTLTSLKFYSDGTTIPLGVSPASIAVFLTAPL